MSYVILLIVAFYLAVLYIELRFQRFIPAKDEVDPGRREPGAH